MTTYLDFRTEPLSNVPRIRVVKQPDRSFSIVCDGETCVFVDNAPDEVGADEIKAYHEKWHEDGMPQ